MGAFKFIARTKADTKENGVEQAYKRDKEVLRIFREASKKGRPKK